MFEIGLSWPWYLYFHAHREGSDECWCQWHAAVRFGPLFVEFHRG